MNKNDTEKLVIFAAALNAFGTFGMFGTFETQILICDLWALCVGLVSVSVLVSETAGEIHLSDDMRCKVYRHLSE